MFSLCIFVQVHLVVVGVAEVGEEEEAVAAGVVTEEEETEITDNSNTVSKLMTSTRKVENILAATWAGIFVDQLLTHSQTTNILCFFVILTKFGFLFTIGNVQQEHRFYTSQGQCIGKDAVWKVA